MHEVIHKQGIEKMRKTFSGEPDWAWYDGADATTAGVRNYWMTPTLGGGSLLDDLQTPTDPAIKTPMADLLDAEATKTFGFWAIDKIQYTRNSPYYFVDVLLLATDERMVEDLDMLKAAVNAHKCCWHDEQHWATAITGFARVYYYRVNETGGDPDYLYGLYEG